MKVLYTLCQSRKLCTISCPLRINKNCLIKRQNILLRGVVINMSKQNVHSEEYMNEISLHVPHLPIEVEEHVVGLG
jgi:hypothetical protein